jgi:uncharacterized protein (DUF1501 family)
MRAYSDARLGRLEVAPALIPRARRNRDFYRSAAANSGALKDFADALPPDNELFGREEAGPVGSTLKRQAQIALTAFIANSAVSADMWLAGFDTHDTHDTVQAELLANLTESVDFLWELAETLQIADRLVVVLASDFGRTNHYNSDAGKDHWPIGSVVVMEKNQSWTNRVIGTTTPLHHAQAMNPSSLLVDESSGTIIYPRHVHKALRNYLGIGNAPVAAPFPFNNTEDFAFFT